MARNIITGIDAGSSAVRVIVAEQKNNGGLNILGVGQKQSEGIKRGYISNLDDAIKSFIAAIRIAEKTAGIPVKKAIISIGGISLSSIKSKGAVMVSRADGEITDFDVRRAIEQSEANLPNISNKRIIHTIPTSFKIDNSQIFGRPTGMKGTKLEAEILFITCLNQHVLDMIKAVEETGVNVEDVIAAPLALSQTTLSKTQKETGCVLADIGANTMSLVVFEEGLPISLEVFPIGSTHITNDIALGLKISLDDAENIKIHYSDSLGKEKEKRKIFNIIEARLSDIFDLIESHLKKINRNEMLPAGIILTGGGSNLFNLEDIAKSSLKLPAKIGTYALRGKNHLNVTASSNALKDQIFNDPGWSLTLGLCLINSNSIYPETDNAEKIRSGITNSVKNWLRKLLP